MNRCRKLLILQNRPDEAWTRRSYAFRGFGLVQTLWLLLVGKDSKSRGKSVRTSPNGHGPRATRNDECRCHLARVAGYVTMGARLSRRPKSTANVTYIHGNARMSRFMAR